MTNKNKRILLMMMVLFITAILFLTACGGTAATEEPMEESQTVTGTGQGYAGPVVVEITAVNGTLVSIEVIESEDTPGLSEGAYDSIIEAVLENQSTAGVDAVSGATGSSEGILAAIEDALSQLD